MGWLRNPVYWRELMGILRTPRAVVLLSLTVIVLTGLIALRWPANGVMDLEGHRAREIFRLIGCGLGFGVVLMAPAFPATSIISERQSGTLALLFNSQLQPAQIYFGKLLGGITFMMLAMLATLPAAAASYAMGGVSLSHHILPLYGLLLLAVVHYTAVSLVVSAWAGTPDSALRTSYGLVFLLSCATVAPHYFTRGTVGLAATVSEWLYHLSPLPALMTLLGARLPTPDGLEIIPFGDLAIQHVQVAGSATLLWIVAGLLLLRPRLLDRSRDAGVMTDDRSTGARFARRVLMLVDPQRRSRSVNRFVNPLLIKELRTRRFGRTSWMLRLVAVCAIVSLAITFGAMKTVNERGISVVGSILIAMQVLLMVLLTPSLTAGLISAERENGGWQLLKMTPLSALRIVTGKLLSVVTTLLLLLMATLPSYQFLLLISEAKFPEVIRVIGSLLLIALFCMMVGAGVGCLFRRAALATVAAYAVLLVFFGGTLLIWLGRDAPFGYDVVRSALLLNPAVAPLSIVGAADFNQYELLPEIWYWTGGISLGFFGLLVFQSWRLTKPE